MGMRAKYSSSTLDLMRAGDASIAGRLDGKGGGGGLMSHQHQVVSKARHVMGMRAKHSSSALELMQ